MRLRVVASVVTAIVLLAGCDGDRVERSDREPSGRESSAPAQAPDPGLPSEAVVATARRSVARLRVVAHGCQKMSEGSGFVVAPNRVMTNAHVVAGGDTFSVDIDGTTRDARVVSFDPNADLSILDVPSLTALPLTFSASPATSGTNALILGYPGGDAFAATPARIREVITLKGPDIYRTITVNREVYLMGGTVTTGDSGGPLIDRDGRVLGVVFGAATDDRETSFALTAAQVAPHMASVGNTESVTTGACLG